MKFTSLNIEQNIARYVADNFKAKGYDIYWWDTKRYEGSGSRVLTIVREFPEDPAYIVSQSEPQENHLIRVPAFTVQSFRDPTARDVDRTGIGDLSFEWSAGIRVDGFAGSEKEYYDFAAWFREWFNPNTRIPLRDYHVDLTNPAPPIEFEPITVEDVDIFRSESREATPAATRYYVAMTAIAKFIE